MYTLLKPLLVRVGIFEKKVLSPDGGDEGFSQVDEAVDGISEILLDGREHAFDCTSQALFGGIRIILRSVLHRLSTVLRLEEKVKARWIL